MHRFGINFRRRGLFLRQAPEARDGQYLDLLQVHHIHLIPQGSTRAERPRHPQGLNHNFTSSNLC